MTGPQGMGPLVASAPSTPINFGTLALWLDASDTSTIDNSAGRVTQWNDKSGNNRHVTASLGARPWTNTQTINGMNVIEIQSANNMTRPDCGLGTDDFTLYVVFQKTGANQTFEAAPVTMTQTNEGKPFDRYSSTAFGSTWIIGPQGVTGFSDIRSQTTPCQFCWRAVKDLTGIAGRHELAEYKNGILVLESTANYNTNYWEGNRILSIGRRADGATQFIGKIGEALIYEGAHDAPTRSLVQAYLGRWGV